LAKWIRPTTSSEMGAHEKVETKSPPRKAHVAKPKRKSEIAGWEQMGGGTGGEKWCLWSP
jgi:hypothetical protein